MTGFEDSVLQGWALRRWLGASWNVEGTFCCYSEGYSGPSILEMKVRSFSSAY
jgi:hypothetical protein